MLIISNMKTKFINQPFSKRAMMVLAVLFTALTAGATQFITDVMVNAKNNKASDKFVLKNADIDGSGKITQSDIDAVVKIILKK